MTAWAWAVKIITAIAKRVLRNVFMPALSAIVDGLSTAKSLTNSATVGGRPTLFSHLKMTSFHLAWVNNLPSYFSLR